MLNEGLRLIRVFHDYKISEIARDLNISAGYLSEIENGKKEPSMAVLKKYSEHFNMSISAIMFFAEEIEKENKKPIKKYARKQIIKFLQFIENATT